MNTTPNRNSGGDQPAAGRRNARRVAHRRAAPAPTVAINLPQDRVRDLQSMMAEFQDLREILAYHGDEDGVDGDYGDRTYRAIALIAREAGISAADIPNIKFFDDQDPLFTRWKTALQNHHKEGETPPQVVARVNATAPDTAAADAAAAAEAARRQAEANRLAAEAAARADADARVPAAIRGTEYDPRNIAPLNQDQRYALAVRGLFALDELASERSTPSLENIHDKMKETVRRVNRELGTSYPIPTEANPLSDSALEALGRRVAMAGGIRGNEESIYRNAQTQDQLNAAAARGLRALDRTASGRYDPTDAENAQRLQRNIRKFEREVMGLSRVEADGIADSAMLAALERALRERGGLAQVTGGQAVVAAAVTSAPPPSTPAQAPVETTAPSTENARAGNDHDAGDQPNTGDRQADGEGQGEGTNPRDQRDRRVRVEGGEDVDAPGDQRLPRQTLVDRRPRTIPIY